jgi:hypothetical protein
MPQEIENFEPLEGGLVKPKDDTTVYATDALSKTHKVGEAIVCHKALAEKLIAKGKATKQVKGKKEVTE